VSARVSVIKIEQAAETLSLFDLALSSTTFIRKRNPILNSLVVALGMIVRHVFLEDMPE